MAITGSFKQQCPSCEASVPIKDGSLIGKKVDCPKCKYRFVVEDPVAKDKVAVGKANRPADADQVDVVDEVDDVDAVDEVDDADAVDEVEEVVTTKPKPNGKKAPAKPIAKHDDANDEDADDEDEPQVKKPKKKKEEKGNGKLILGLAVATVGLIVLGVAGLFVSGAFSGKSDKPAPGPQAGGGGGGGAGKEDDKKGRDLAGTGTGKGKKPDPPLPEKEKKIEVEIQAPKAPPGGAGGVELTNILPPNSQSILHLNLKDLHDSPFGTIISKTPGAFNDSEFISRLGFELTIADDMYICQSYTEQWFFMVLHLSQPINDMNQLSPMNLKKWSGNKTKHDCFVVNRNADWLSALTKLAVFVPSQVRNVLPAEMSDKLVLMHMRDTNTLLFGNPEPMLAYLKVDGKVAPWGGAARNAMPAGPALAFGHDHANKAATEQLMMSVQFFDPTEGLQFLGQQGDGQPKAKELGKVGDPGSGSGGKGKDPGTGQGPGTGKDPGTGQGPGQGPDPGAAPGAGAGAAKAPAYLTIHPTLRDMLLRVESRPETDKLLFSIVTNLNAARLKSEDPEEVSKKFYRPAPIWDLVNMLDEKTDRLLCAASSLTMKQTTAYLFQTSLTCGTDAETTQLERDLKEMVAPEVISFFKKVIQHKVELIKEEAPPPGVGTPGGTGEPGAGIPGKGGPGSGIPGKGGPGSGQPPIKVEVTKSRIVIKLDEKVVDFKLDLVFDGPSQLRMAGAVKLIVCGMRQEVELAAGGHAWRHDLAEAGRKLGELGLQKPAFKQYRAFDMAKSGTFPLGAFPRGLMAKRADRDPINRVGWMAGLLPYLGHDTLYNQINFDKSWRDEENWMAARTLVAQFIDPTYPSFSRYSPYPGMPLDTAATHYVGISGVGIDSADYLPGDPALLGKLGIFGYERATSLETIVKQGRGLSHTVLLIRVPCDGPAGVTPWMAGGGSTVRAVPDKNSLEPFLSTDANGKRGTYVLMADGSVRHIKAGIADTVFKAMCTVDGPTRADFDPDHEELITKEARPKTEVASKDVLLPGWKVHASSEGGFSVALPPGTMATVEEKQDMKPLGKFTVKGLDAASATTAFLYQVRYFDLSADLKKQAADAQLEAVATAIEQFAARNNGVAKRKGQIALGKTPGLAFELSEKQGGGALRVFVTSQRVYILRVESPDFSLAARDVQDFFGSFKLK